MQKIDTANTEALRRMLAGDPVLVDVMPAGEAIGRLGERHILRRKVRPQHSLLLRPLHELRQQWTKTPQCTHGIGEMLQQIHHYHYISAAIRLVQVFDRSHLKIDPVLFDAEFHRPFGGLDPASLPTAGTRDIEEESYVRAYLQQSLTPRRVTR